MPNYDFWFNHALTHLIFSPTDLNGSWKALTDRSMGTAPLAEQVRTVMGLTCRASNQISQCLVMTGLSSPFLCFIFIFALIISLFLLLRTQKKAYLQVWHNEWWLLLTIYSLEVQVSSVFSPWSLDHVFPLKNAKGRILCSLNFGIHQIYSIIVYNLIFIFTCLAFQFIIFSQPYMKILSMVSPW